MADFGWMIPEANAEIKNENRVLWVYSRNAALKVEGMQRFVSTYQRQQRNKGSLEAEKEGRGGRKMENVREKERDRMEEED